MSNMPNCGPTAGAGGEPDPIFAAIERHRAAFGIWQAAYDRLGALQDRWEFNEMPRHSSDAPEWIEANTALLAAVEELAKAFKSVLSTPPTTIPGVADLLDYVGRYECHPVTGTAAYLDKANWSYEPVSECYLVLRNAPNNFLPMIATTLPRTATAEPDPIFGAIERHRAAVLAAIDRRGVLKEMIPEARRGIYWRFLIELMLYALCVGLFVIGLLRKPKFIFDPSVIFLGLALLLAPVRFYARWKFGERPNDWTDGPEWIEANPALLEAYEEMDKALEAVLSSPPITIAGVADLLDYVSRDDEADEGGGGTIFENALNGDVEGIRKAAVNFLPMIAAALRSLTAESTSR